MRCLELALGTDAKSYVFLLSDDLSNHFKLAKELPLDGRHIFALMLRTIYPSGSH